MSLGAALWVPGPALAAPESPPTVEGAPKPQQPTLAQALSVEPGASCVDRQRLIAHVKMWLGGDRVVAAVRVAVHGDPVDPHKLWFELERDGQSSRRSFEQAPDSCDDLHAVLGLSIALALDAERLRDLVAPPEPAPPRLKLVSAQLSFAYDLLPESSLGAALGGELGLLPWLSLRADALLQYSWNDSITGTRGRFDALFGGGSLQVCGGGRPDARLRLALCAGLATGALHAWGTDYSSNGSDTGLWLGVRSGLRFQLDLGIPWLLDVDVMSAIVAPTFTAAHGGEELARESSRTGFVVSLGPGWSW